MLLLAALLGTASAGEGLDDVKEAGRLVWGADQEGGGPYVYPRDDDPSQVTGFEVEIAAALGRYLGVEPVFAQGQWDRMPELLRTGKIDVVMNGYEWMPARAETMQSSIPYYVYGLQLLVDRDSGIDGWDDLRAPRPDGGAHRIGVLSGSAAEEWVAAELPEAELIAYDSNTAAMREVENGKLEATLADTPIASFYAPSFPELVPVGEPVAPGYYVIYARQDDVELIRAIDEALIVMIRNGDLERIYRKYGMWNDAQAELLRIADAGRFYGFASAANVEVGGAEPITAEAVETGTTKRGWAVVRDYGGILLWSAGLTVVLSVLSFPLAVGLGLLVALGRAYGPWWARGPLAAYVEFLRGTPVMLQLFFIFFFLPEIGINVPAFWTAILGLGINYSAYESEIYRAGLQAVPKGQMEAALSLGMTRSQALRQVIVPQATRIVIPPVVNDFIALFKDTSVCSVVTLIELTKRFSVLSQSTQATVELMLLTGLLYLMMSYPLSLASRRLEARLAT